MTIYSCVTNKNFDEIEKEFEGKGYGIFKVAVAEAIIKKLKPVQDRYNELIQNSEYLEKIYIQGKEAASKLAKETLKEVYNKVGLI